MHSEPVIGFGDGLVHRVEAVFYASVRMEGEKGGSKLAKCVFSTEEGSRGIGGLSRGERSREYRRNTKECVCHTSSFRKWKCRQEREGLECGCSDRALLERRLCN